MLFNSFDFVFFLPVAVVLYFALPHKYRWVWLLAASYFFYACWKVEYLVLIVFSTLVDYWAGLKMGSKEHKKDRFPFLLLSLFTNLGLLFFFKYYNFFSGSINEALGAFNIFSSLPYLKILLPVGISFYTFQTLAYSIDVYRGQKEAETHLGYFAVYVSFFPQLVAGPIERSQTLLPQFKEPHRFSYEDTVWGLTKMGYGFLKKLVIADRMAIYVNSVFDNLESASSMSATLAVLFFAVQIYCDFSGYSDIAIGSAKIMGFDLMENFKRPYLSRSVREFWARWHISLSTWFRDYLYIPLGGNRVSRKRFFSNLFIVFLVSGLWHGANWTFVIWGALHGIYLIGEILLKPWKEKFWGLFSQRQDHTWKKLRSYSAILSTFIFVNIAWVFFRADSLSQAMEVFKIIFNWDMNFSTGPLFAGWGFINFALNLLAVGLLVLTYLLPINLKIKYPLAFLIAVFVTILLLGVDGTDQFIYFQF